MQALTNGTPKHRRHWRVVNSATQLLWRQPRWALLPEPNLFDGFRSHGVRTGFLHHHHHCHSCLDLYEEYHLKLLGPTPHFEAIVGPPCCVRPLLSGSKLVQHGVLKILAVWFLRSVSM